MTVWYRVCRADYAATSFWIHILVYSDHWSSCYMVSPACNSPNYSVELSSAFPGSPPHTARAASINSRIAGHRDLVAHSAGSYHHPITKHFSSVPSYSFAPKKSYSGSNSQQ